MQLLKSSCSNHNQHSQSKSLIGTPNFGVETDCLQATSFRPTPTPTPTACIPSSLKGPDFNWWAPPIVLPTPQFPSPLPAKYLIRARARPEIPHAILPDSVSSFKLGFFSTLLSSLLLRTLSFPVSEEEEGDLLS